MTGRALACAIGVVAAQWAADAAQSLDACTVLSAGEITSAFGRKELTAGKPGRASAGYSDCRFAGSAAGDVRITLSPALANAKDDFTLKTQIYAEEGKRVEKLAVGDGAYYWDDTIEFRVGSRIVSIRVNRAPRTESAAAVRSALTLLARRVTERLRAGR